MTLNIKIGILWLFFGDFGLRDTFQERIVPKVIIFLLLDSFS